MTKAKSLFDPIDNLVEARAGYTGIVYLQAKNAFGNNRLLGGDEIRAKFRDSVNPDIQCRGNVVDNGDGSYFLSYSIPLTGDYVVSITMNGESVQYCVGPNGKRWDSRSYDGVRVYTSPSFCSLDDSLTLNVIHRSNSWAEFHTGGRTRGSHAGKIPFALNPNRLSRQFNAQLKRNQNSTTCPTPIQSKSTKIPNRIVASKSNAAAENTNTLRQSQS
eukprot:scaffold59716_cov38-Cyclotella_meneghiniana.AAC.1